MSKDLRKKHSLYPEYFSLLSDDIYFSDTWKDTDVDFYEWVMTYKTDVL